MCSSKLRGLQRSSSFNGPPPPPNRVPLLERRNSFNNTSSGTIFASSNKTATKCNSISGEAAAAAVAGRREQFAILQEQRKVRIAQYGRAASRPPLSNNNSNDNIHHPTTPCVHQQDKRCTFITPNSDPVYVAYHDQEWGVPVHDDKLLFELLVLTGAQVGSDWTSVLRRRQDFRNALSGFDVDIISKLSEKKMSSIAAEYCMDLGLLRGVVDNSKRIIEVKKEFGSFDKYLWGFVNHKPIMTQYKWCHMIPPKTSKSETISKDMVRRGFRLVGPTVIHSFMQAAGLTNDHLITCTSRHSSSAPVPNYNQYACISPSSPTPSSSSSSSN